MILEILVKFTRRSKELINGVQNIGSRSDVALQGSSACEIPWGFQFNFKLKYQSKMHVDDLHKGKNHQSSDSNSNPPCELKYLDSEQRVPASK